MSKGPKGSVDYWFNSGYCIGLLEYCCNTLRMKRRIMCETMGESYLHNYIERSIPEFIRHKVCITEVGNALLR